MTSKCYSELIKIPTFEERLQYLQLFGLVGMDTFGPYRYLIQKFRQSGPWKMFRRDMIIRDNGCDLAMPGHEINQFRKTEDGRIINSPNILLHHIVPCSVDDIINHNFKVLMNPENVITTQYSTHQQIHFGKKEVIEEIYKPRTPNDTCPWR